MNATQLQELLSKPHFTPAPTGDRLARWIVSHESYLVTGSALVGLWYLQTNRWLRATALAALCSTAIVLSNRRNMESTPLYLNTVSDELSRRVDDLSKALDSPNVGSSMDSTVLAIAGPQMRERLNGIAQNGYLSSALKRAPRNAFWEEGEPVNCKALLQDLKVELPGLSLSQLRRDESALFAYRIRASIGSLCVVAASWIILRPPARLRLLLPFLGSR